MLQMEVESLFRRTTLCNGLLQNIFYPILPNECIITQDVTVFRDIDCNILNNPFLLDFIACPGIQNPKLDNKCFNQTDELILRTKIKCIFQIAQQYALVLGPRMALSTI